MLCSIARGPARGAASKTLLGAGQGDWVNDRQHVRLALTKYTNRHGERRVSVDTEGMESHTVFNLLKRYREFSLLEADLKTGRTHQIRVHLSHLGFPIVGDDKYGDFELNKRIARGGPTSVCRGWRGCFCTPARSTLSIR